MLVQVKRKRKIVSTEQPVAPDNEVIPEKKMYKIPEIEDVMRRQKTAKKYQDAIKK